MSKKKEWIARLAEYKKKHGNTISIKELSALTWNEGVNVLSYDKIYKDYKKEILIGTQLGPDGSHCSIIIDVKDAEEYFKSFHYCIEDLTPPTKLLPFPDFSGEKLLQTA